MRFGIVALWIVLLGLGCAIIAHARFSTDMSAFLPRAPTPVQRVLVDQVRDGGASRLLLAGIDGVPLSTAIAMDRAMTVRLSADPAFALVRDGALSDLGADGRYIWSHRYLLGPDIAPARFTVEGLHRALTDDLARLASGSGAMTERTLAADPTGETTTLAQQLTQGETIARRDGIWTDPRGTMSLLIVETKAPGSDLDSQETALASLNAAFDAVKATIPDAASARLSITGPGVFGVHARAAMKRQTTRLSAIASTMVAALLLAAYRSPAILLLAFLPVASGVVAGIAAVALGFGTVHGITVGFGVTLIGEAVDYSIYYFTYAAAGTSGLARLWPILRLGMLLSVVGFAAMLFSGFAGFAQLGLFTVAGLAAAYLVARFVLPVLAPRGRVLHVPPMGIRATLPRRAGPILCTGIALASLGLLASHHRGLWEDDLTSLSPASPSDLVTDRTLRAATSASLDSRYFALVAAPDLQTALERTEALAPTLAALKTNGNIGGFESPTLVLPSDAMQRRRESALPDAGTLRANLAEAMAGLPFQPGLFTPFLSQVDAARKSPPVTRDDLAGTSLGLKFDASVAHDADGWTTLTTLSGLRDADAVAATLSKAGAVFVDLKAASNGLLLDYRREALTLAACGYAAMAALLLVMLRKPRRVAAVLLPLALAVLATAALSTVGGHRLSIFTLFGLLLTVAVGSNYCLFFERRVAGEPLALGPLVLANLGTLTGFGILSFSAIPVLRGIGGTVAVGAFLSLVFGALLIPPRESAA